MSTAKESTSPAELRDFGLILAAGFVAFFGLLIPLLKGRGVHLLTWPWFLAAALALLSFAAPGILAPLRRVWLFAGHILGWINTRIILGVIFLVIFTPAAVLFRLMGKDPMQRSVDAGLKSYRRDSRQPQSENLTRPY